MEIVKKSIKDLKPYENNPRRNESAVESVANSIKEFGFLVPIVLDKDDTIIAGHTRYKAAESLGLAEVPCIYAEGLTEEQVKAFRIADNKTGEVADWNFFKLADELKGIENVDLSEFAFDDFELESITNLGKELDSSYDLFTEGGEPQHSGTYEPVLAPETAHTEITEKNIAETKEKMRKHVLASTITKMKTMMCPYCGKEFEVDD